jgi:uncharacterized protein (TIGR03083 family)
MLAPPVQPPQWIRDALLATATGEGPLGPYSHVTDRLDALLARLDEFDWQARATPMWSVQELVAHLTAVDGVLAEWLASPGQRPQDCDDLDARTTRSIATAHVSTPEQTRSRWRAQVRQIAGLLHAAGPGQLDALLPFAGFEVPVRHLLLDRAFEAWIHAEDIAIATGHEFDPPPPEHMHALAETAIGLLPALLPTSRPGGLARVTLTGSGGGSWDVPLGPDPVDLLVQVSADVTEFCRFVGGRRTIATLEHLAVGDAEVATELLTAAGSLARA